MKLLALLLSFTIVNVCTAQVPREKTLLWKISGKGITQPSYIYGTFHLLCPSDFNMPDTVQSIFLHTKQLYLEFDINDPGLTPKMMMGIIMKDGHTLKDYMKPEEYDSVSRIFQVKTKFPLMMVCTYKPLMLVSMLYPSMSGCTPIGYEQEFAKLAKKDSVTLKGLETIDDQLAIFEQIPYQAQAKMLLKNMYDFERSQGDLRKLIQCYKEKDINALRNGVDDDKDMAKYSGILLTKRNHNWIPVIAKAATESSSFFAWAW